jgi:hypothetical protein
MFSSFLAERVGDPLILPLSPALYIWEWSFRRLRPGQDGTYIHIYTANNYLDVIFSSFLAERVGGPLNYPTMSSTVYLGVVLQAFKARPGRNL